MTIDIQELTLANQSYLNNIGHDVFDHDIIADQLRAFLDDPRHLMYVAIDADLVVGMASAFEYFHPDKQAQLFINEVGVASTHRRQGIGRALVTKLIGVAKDRECSYAWLGTEETNTAAQACFGSVSSGEKPQSFLLYEWDLED